MWNGGSIMDKPALRAHFRALRGRMDSRLRDGLSMRACSRVLESSLWAKAGSVLLYAPIGAELDVRPLLEAGWRQGKTVLLPKCEENPRGLRLCRVEGWTALSPGAWGILEPGEGCLCLPPEAVDLALVPVVAMDSRGIRLGNGGGYYDRLMPRLPCAALMGFDQQLCGHLPREAHDAAAQWIITPTQMTRLGE